MDKDSILLFATSTYWLRSVAEEILEPLWYVLLPTDLILPSVIIPVSQELEALIMTLLKDTRSEIYSINTQIREIVIHEYYPKPTKAPTNAPKNAPAPTHAPAPAAVIPPRQEDAKPAFIRRPIRNGEGEIEVDESRAGPRRLEISLLRARHLPKFDRLGTIDGYCMLNFAGKDFETKVVKNTYSPDWNEKFTFEIDDVSKRPSAVSITVMDWDRLSKNEKVGEIVITSERMWDVLRTRDNWTEERERGIINNKMPVVGNDKQNSEVTIAIKVLEPTEKQKEAWNLAQAKLKGPEVKIPVPVVQQVATSVPNAAKATAPTATAIKTPNKGPCRLELTIVRARHLPKMDTFNSIDAYCFAEYGDHTYKTEVKKNTYSPDWNAVEVFKIYDMSQVKKPLSITLFDWNAVGKNDKVGQVLLGPERISNLLVNGFGWQEEKDFNIVNDSGKEVIGNDSSKSIITLKVRILEPTPQQLQQYVDAGVVPSAAVSTVQPTPPKVPTKAPGRLELTILRGRHMPKMDMLQSIDTFCTVDFAGQTFKTEVRKNTYSPDWNAVDVFRIDDMSQVKNPLYLTVYDWDTVKKNDKIGQVTLLPADISRVLANGYGWQEEAEYSIINDQGREVIGNDKLKSVISLKLKVLEPVPDQLQQFAKAQPVVTPLVNKTKLSAQGLPGPKTEITPPSIPSAPKAAVDQERALAIQRASELAKAQTLAIAQAQAKAAAEAKALQESKASAARDTAEAEAVVAARTKKHAEKVIISKEVDKVIPPPHPSEQVDRKQQPWGDLNLGSVQRNSEVCDKSCSEMQSMLNSIRVIKLHA